MRGSDSSNDSHDADAQLAHLLFHQHQRLFQQLVHVDPINFTRPARKAKHLANDVRNSFRLFSRDLEKARVFVAFGARLHQVERILDRFERIVDFMSDRGRETSDSRELFRFEQLLLDAASLELTNLSQIVKNGNYSGHLAGRSKTSRAVISIGNDLPPPDRSTRSRPACLFRMPTQGRR